jgi:hypothetical protein
MPDRIFLSVSVKGSGADFAVLFIYYKWLSKRRIF